MRLPLLMLENFASVAVVFDDAAKPNPFDVDVVIVGAGFSGLTVATELRRHGVSIVVLEALDRLGGTVEATREAAGRLVDTGAQFVNDEMTEVLALAGRAGAIRAIAVHPRQATLTVEDLQSWFPCTLYSIATHLAEPLVDVLRLGCPVRAIHLHDSSVDVVALDQVWHAREVVVAAPPNAYAGLGFTPPLPDDIAHAAESFAAGTVIKYVLSFEQPFWLDGGNQSLGHPGLCFADASTADSATLVAFVGGTIAVEWVRHSQAQRSQAIVHHASALFGDEALRPVSVVERIWVHDEWGAGGFGNMQSADGPHGVDALAVGFPLVTFASSELALRFPGYVEGAIVAGQAAAAQVLQRLRHA